MQGAGRYTGFTPLDLTDRSWPGRRISAAPRWLSTDLRDGNQSLARPMSPERKLMMFDLLVRIGFKEIEVGFPVASQDDHDFVRLLIERDLIPDDVRITVLTQAREELIRATVDCLRGAPRAMVHIYNATSPLFRELVFGLDRAGCRDLAVRATRVMMDHAERALPGCDLAYQYSPELFNETEPDFALEVCEAVMDAWQPEAGRGIILNFPTTVERSLPNVFADQIEWLDRNLSRREHVCLSIHPHNDRGTGVAAAELALLAGAERIEGCLFGNGERAGNVCLVTLCMNLFTHGIDPGVDLSDINDVRRTVEECNQMTVHPRHPYAGDLVYTAFSGSHQDAIKKGFDELERHAEQTGVPAAELPWSTPYLPVDPKDVGRTYEAVVRVNSQSGKGGVAYVMSAWHGLALPRGLQADLAALVQARADAEGGELSPGRIGELFREEYVDHGAPAELFVPITATLWVDGAVPRDLRQELGPWGIEVRAVHGSAPALARQGAPGRPSLVRRAPHDVVVYAECGAPAEGAADVASGPGTAWGVGAGSDVTAAAFSAVRAAGTRLAERARRRPARPLEPRPLAAAG
ncbi:2-isopropylmalate synthase [Nonomuraea sp. SBT364]|uniref:2-isopropylmalate synthase n=1 Tax=Nonomuraea sp. SBT364 TaxID=1580530 RepID=UPI00066BE799|nr:2-isopropylmalate synthase [Nonomuraea sp. SBT364]